jgi:two-component system, chemotaxis family, CheB/CheR fusion protein
MPVIDVHTHMFTERFMELLKAQGGIYNLQTRPDGQVEIYRRDTHPSIAVGRLPAIMITGNSDVPIAVQAMKAGASDFIEKPVGRSELLAAVERALTLSRDSSKLTAWRETAADRLSKLTPRQRQIMVLVLSGHHSKNIAADLRISQRTVENHRNLIMKKTGSKSLPALARLAMAAEGTSTEEPRA